ncbi:tyrosine-type recombinase/integrase [Streptomyces sp. SCL15-4]|uniref:tyrosine-type recombinase/integrase n=1 Tax=Streptomyces sp. SCL15-4 TaxID=2967221 RepID=UPI00296779C2|nr:tyrosine-type recombinase/integrase [Streptomyces sp. SCL15-4]
MAADRTQRSGDRFSESFPLKARARAWGIERAYNLTSSIMRAAVDDDVIAVSLCRSIDLPPIAVKPSQWFTLDQAQSILDELPTACKTMCLLGFYTGLRWGELSGLHCHRIDRRRSRLFVVEVNTESGIKEYPKSSKSRREVPLPPHVLEALERHIHRLDRDALVFTTITKGRPGRHLDDGNWRRQTRWPVDAACSGRMARPAEVSAGRPGAWRCRCAGSRTCR